MPKCRVKQFFAKSTICVDTSEVSTIKIVEQISQDNKKEELRIVLQCFPFNLTNIFTSIFAAEKCDLLCLNLMTVCHQNKRQFRRKPNSSRGGVINKSKKFFLLFDERFSHLRHGIGVTVSPYE